MDVVPIGTSDYYILIPCICLVYLLIIYYQKNFVAAALRPYLLPAITAKIIAALLFSFIYGYYYRFGDTFNYFHDSSLLYNYFLVSPLKALSILFFGNGDEFIQLFPEAILAENNASLLVSKFTFLFSLLTYNTYLPTTVVMCLFNFIGSWKFFQQLCQFYPQLKKEMAISTLFIPSVVFWGSGILKDPLCVNFLGIIFYCSMQLFIGGKLYFKYFIALVFGSYFIFIIKPYILFAFAPALLFFFVVSYKNRFNKQSRKFITPVLYVLGILGSFLVLYLFGISQFSSFQNLLEVSQSTQYNINTVEDSGSSYALSFDADMLGLITAAPLAINITLFRPYLWEIKSPFMLMAALESIILLVLTLKIIWNTGLRKLIYLIADTPLLLLLITFSLIFSVFVGISTGNFGTLVRYKIPCLPFYWAFFFIINSYSIKPKKTA